MALDLEMCSVPYCTWFGRNRKEGGPQPPPPPTHPRRDQPCVVPFRPWLVGLSCRTPGAFTGRSQGQVSALCALGPLQLLQAHSQAVGCSSQPVWQHHLCLLAVKECGSSAVVPRAAAAPMPCNCGAVWQHVPVTRRLRSLAHYSTVRSVSGSQASRPGPEHRAHTSTSPQVFLGSSNTSQKHAPLSSLIPLEFINHQELGRPNLGNTTTLTADSARLTGSGTSLWATVS